MTKIVNVMLTFTNPKKLDFLHLTNLLFKAESLTEQNIYIASPPTKLIHYSCERIPNIRLSNILSLNEIDDELVDKIKKSEYKYLK
jgi:hypothetical protein